MDITRFTALMKMTTSTHDGEAINAMRLANRMLKKHNLTWDDVTKTMIVQTPRQKVFAETAAPRGPTGYSRGKAYEDLKRAMEEAARQTEEFARKQRETKEAFKATGIRRRFAYLRKNLEPGHVRDFIGAMHVEWRKDHKLTEEQISRLEKVYRNCIKQRGHDEESAA